MEPTTASVSSTDKRRPQKDAKGRTDPKTKDQEATPTETVSEKLEAATLEATT